MASPDSVTDILARIAAMRSELASLGVTRIGIFGSRTTGQARPGSDLDVLVELEPGRDLLDLVAVKNHLAQTLGLSIDITTPSGIRPEDRPRILESVLYAA